MKRTFNYVNHLGYHKRLVVEDIPEDDVLHCLLFGNGEFCGEGMLHRVEINQMLEHYGAKGRV